MPDNTTTDETDPPAIHGEVNADELAEFIAAHTLNYDPEKLADDLAPLLKDRPDLNGGNSEIDIDELADVVADKLAERDDFGYGEGRYGDWYSNGELEIPADVQEAFRELTRDEIAASIVPLQERLDALESRDQSLKDLHKRVDDLADRVEEALDSVSDRLAGQIGPDFEPSAGAYHAAGRWGIHFRTTTPRKLTTATVDTVEPGTFEAVLARYDGDDRYEPYAVREIDVSAGRNDVRLDMDVPAGEWLLTRPSEFALRRSEWGGWGPTNDDSLTLVGGSKPGDYTKPNSNWYYYYHLKQQPASDGADALLGPTTPPAMTEETEYSTPGRGVHFSSESAFDLGTTTLRANRSGTLYAELHAYDGNDVQGIVDQTELHISRGEDIHEIDLDLSGSAGEYLLCRDYQAKWEGFDVQTDGVALARTQDYAYFEHDSRDIDWLTVHGSAHPEFSSSGDWFNFYQVHVRQRGDTTSKSEG
jgi:hypothetical protein